MPGMLWISNPNINFPRAIIISQNIERKQRQDSGRPKNKFAGLSFYIFGLKISGFLLYQKLPGRRAGQYMII